MIEPLVVEHRMRRLECPACGRGLLTGLSDGVSASAFGPRMAAHLTALVGVYRRSRRQIADAVRGVFGCSISIGAVDSAIMRTELRALPTRG